MCPKYREGERTAGRLGYRAGYYKPDAGDAGRPHRIARATRSPGTFRTKVFELSAKRKSAQQITFNEPELSKPLIDEFPAQKPFRRLLPRQPLHNQSQRLLLRRRTRTTHLGPSLPHLFSKPQRFLRKLIGYMCWSFARKRVLSGFQ